MMKSLTWIFVLLGLSWMTACTRSYSTAPFPENFGLQTVYSTTIPQLDQPENIAGTDGETGSPTSVPTGTNADQPVEGKPFRSLFIPQAGSPVWMANSMHPDAGCNWMGIAGQVFDANSVPIEDLVMTVGGELNGKLVDRVSLTGIAPQYGEGGYEVILADRPIASRQAIWIQILDLEGRPLTAKFFVDTLDDCERNLIIMNFVQASTGELRDYFLPIVQK